jgi:hypothetical protein
MQLLLSHYLSPESSHLSLFISFPNLANYAILDQRLNSGKEINMKSTPVTKYILIYILLGFVVVFSYPTILMAHPPKGLAAEYDIASQKLKVRIDHGSFSPTMHYINKVEIKKNAQLVINQTYKSQPEKNPFEYTYEIPAKVGDVLEIKASCNLFGSKTISITIAKQAN